MEIRYRWEKNETCMFLSAGEISADNYQIKMLENNQITGLLKFRFRQINQQTEYCYTISGRQAMNSKFSGSYIPVEKIKKLLAAVDKTAGQLELYLLDLNNLLLEPEFIYWREEEQAAPEFCYYPEETPRQNFQEHVRTLLQYLLNHIDHKEEASVALVYGLYQIAIKESFRMRDLMGFLFYRAEQEEKGYAVLQQEIVKKAEAIKQEELYSRSAKPDSGETKPAEQEQYSVWLDRLLALVLVSLAAAAVGRLLFCLYRSRAAAGTKELLVCVVLLFSIAVMTAAVVYSLLSAGRSSGQNHIETDSAANLEVTEEPPEPGTVSSSASAGQRDMAVQYSSGSLCSQLQEPSAYYMEENATCVLQPVSEQRSLVWFRYQGKENAEDFFLDAQTSPVYLGKDQKPPHIPLNWPTVSRRHAVFQISQGICTVADCGSTNGTFVNEVRLRPEEPKVLFHGDKISFAEVCFQVQMEEGEEETCILNRHE